MTDDLDKWINETGIDFFKKNLGIKKGQKVLDYGSGWGSNSIAISRIVGPEGLVYAFEKDTDSIKKMLNIAGMEAGENIKVIHSAEKTNIPVKDGKLDAALLYDVIHDYYFNAKEREILFSEMARILRKNGILSVFPHHMNDMEIESINTKILNAGFRYSGKVTSAIIHDSKLIVDSVYNFFKD
ncbi:MAG: class I SAM-dependent methyltransferase [Actinobacteria bacterium]|nr:class I SAM-dependent methyltransferase [Actinomycetota bacterium]